MKLTRKFSQWTIGSQGIVFVFAFVFSLDLTVEILIV